MVCGLFMPSSRFGLACAFYILCLSSLSHSGFNLEATPFAVGLKEATEQGVMSSTAMQDQPIWNKVVIGGANAAAYTAGAAATAAAVYTGLKNAAGTPQQMKQAKRGGEALLKGYGGYQIHKLQKKLSGTKSKDPLSTTKSASTSKQEVKRRQSLKNALKFTLPSAAREGAELGFVVGTGLNTIDEVAGTGAAGATVASVIGSAALGSAIPIGVAAATYGVVKAANCHPTTKKGVQMLARPAQVIADKGLNLLKWSLWAGAAHEGAEIVGADPRLYCNKKYDMKTNAAFAPLQAVTPYSACPDPFQAGVGLYGLYDTFGKPVVNKLKGLYGANGGKSRGRDQAVRENSPSVKGEINRARSRSRSTSQEQNADGEHDISLATIEAGK